MYEGDLPRLQFCLAGHLSNGAWRERWEFWNHGPSRHGIAIESMPARVSDVWEATRIVYQSVANRKQASIWGEKTPHWYDDPLARAAKFPDARFIFLWRDLQAVIASMTRAAATHHFFRKASLITKTILGTEKLKRACDALKFQGRPVYEVHYEELISNPSECMEQICRFLEIPLEPAVTSLKGADRSAVSGVEREHHALLKGDTIVSQRVNSQALPPALQAKVNRYIYRWKQRYENAWPKYPIRLPEGTKVPSFGELWRDCIYCQSAQYWDDAVTLSYALTPIGLAHWWRSRRDRSREMYGFHLSNQALQKHNLEKRAQ